MSDPDPRDQHLDRYAPSICGCSQESPISHRLPSGKFCFLQASTARATKRKDNHK